MNQPSTGRKNPPIQPKTGWSVRDILTAGYRTRYQAHADDGTTGPLRKSYNSAAADTHKGAE